MRDLRRRARGWLKARFGPDPNKLKRLRKQNRVAFGVGTYGEPKIVTYAMDPTRLIVGKYCSIAKNTHFILGGNHRLDTVTTYPFRIRYGLPRGGRDGFPWSKGDILVGSDVWIGYGATILSGVQIGNGAVVMAGAVVTSDIRPFAVVGGVPAREISRRFSDAICAALLEIAWWDWGEDLVAERIPELSDSSVEHFVKKYAR